MQVFSLIGDFFSPHQRAFVAALVQIAMGFGMSLGQLIAGVLGERHRAITLNPTAVDPVPPPAARSAVLTSCSDSGSYAALHNRP
jgi:MFS family permease